MMVHRNRMFGMIRIFGADFEMVSGLAAKTRPSAMLSKG